MATTSPNQGKLADSSTSPVIGAWPSGSVAPADIFGTARSDDAPEFTWSAPEPSQDESVAIQPLQIVGATAHTKSRKKKEESIGRIITKYSTIAGLVSALGFGGGILKCHYEMINTDKTMQRINSTMPAEVSRILQLADSQDGQTFTVDGMPLSLRFGTNTYGNYFAEVGIDMQDGQTARSDTTLAVQLAVPATIDNLESLKQFLRDTNPDPDIGSGSPVLSMGLDVTNDKSDSGTYYKSGGPASRYGNAHGGAIRTMTAVDITEEGKVGYSIDYHTGSEPDTGYITYTYMYDENGNLVKIKNAGANPLLDSIIETMEQLR